MRIQELLLLLLVPLMMTTASTYPPIHKGCIIRYVMTKNVSLPCENNDCNVESVKNYLGRMTKYPCVDDKCTVELYHHVQSQCGLCIQYTNICKSLEYKNAIKANSIYCGGTEIFTDVPYDQDVIDGASLNVKKEDCLFL